MRGRVREGAFRPIAAKGIEEQTRKLFEVCRLCDVPIITFVNKLDREARNPFTLLDEIEQALALDVTPASSPIGMGHDFFGTYDLFADALLLFERGVHDRVTEPVRGSGLDDPNRRGSFEEATSAGSFDVNSRRDSSIQGAWLLRWRSRCGLTDRRGRRTRK